VRFGLLGPCGLFSVWLTAGAAASDDVFQLEQIPGAGRTVAAELVDLDGDGRSDLLQVSYAGIPPVETRHVRLFRQRVDGTLPDQPDRILPLPAGSAAYDVADLDERPGSEILLLRAEGIAVLSMADGSLREIAVPGGTTAGVAPDERGLDRTTLLREGVHGERWLIVPLLGESAVLSLTGEPLGRVRVGSRTNYFIPESFGRSVGETGIQIFHDAPRVNLGDADGDGRTDLLASTRHALRVFLQRPDGHFAREPDQTLPFGLLSEEDHIRASGTVSVLAPDLDADGRADLIVCHTSGGLTSARAETRVHLNREGSWNLEEADQILPEQTGWSGNALLDVDGDGTQELVRVRILLSVLEMVEFFLTGALDARLRVHRVNGSGLLDEKPAVELKLDMPWSLETFRPRGFLFDLGPDLNGDGYADLVASNGGESIEVHLGGAEQQLERRVHRQKADSLGRVRYGNLDGDGLPDLLLYDPTRADAPVWLARNAGRLPGTQPRMTASP
jgi:hypothetical protein